MITQENFITEIFSPYHKEIYNFILSRIGYDKETAEDLFQEVMYRVWEKRDSYNPARASLRTWLYQVTRNYLIDTYRRTNKERTIINLHKIEELVADQLPKWDSEILATEVIKTTMMLKEIEQEYIHLRYVQEMTYSEIAAIVGKRENTVKVATHRAIRKLKKIVNEN